MGKIVSSDREIEVPDGEKIMDACEELGVPFGCHDGLCAACEIEVLEGMENLSERTESEKELGVEGNNRLACQCKMKQGKVKIPF